MNGDMPHVPITTLAGIASLTDRKCSNTTVSKVALRLNDPVAIEHVCGETLLFLSATHILFITFRPFLVLNQLPLPSPLPATTAKSLLYNGRISEEVGTLLVSRDETLVTQLAQSLNQVSTEHM